MAGERARELPYQQTHIVAKKLTFANMGATVDIGDVPACDVISVRTVKQTDFNSGTTGTITVGVKYSDGTSATAAGLVSAASLLSGVAQGPTLHTFVDNAVSSIAVPATLTATLAQTGTAATAGEADVIVEYVPKNHIKP